MKNKKMDQERIQKQKLREYGADIFSCPNYHKSSQYIQHGRTSVKKHSILVALVALKICQVFRISVKERELVRGALLHDYFLYDWHQNPDAPHNLFRFYRMHGFTHPMTALNNAKKDFQISETEAEIIRKHMWPLTLVPPMCREAWIVMMADKCCSIWETLFEQKSKLRQRKTRRKQ